MLQSFAHHRQPLVTAASLLIVLAVVGIASTASATVMKYMGIVDLVEDSEVIVHATIANHEFFSDDSRDGQVMTRWTLDVKHAYHGAQDGEKIQFLQWGGIGPDGMGHRIPGDAELQKGQEILIFLNRSKKDSKLYLTALGQSKYSIVRTEKSVQAIRDLSSVAIFDGEMAKKIAHGKAEERDYDSLKAELESLIAAIKGGAK